MGVSVERVQTGIRMEKRILKVLKGVAEYLDLTLGDLLEGVVLHAFEGKRPFGAATRGKIDQLRKIYGLDLDAGSSHLLVEPARAARRPGAAKGKRSGSAATGRRRQPSGV
jgi:hypothetical protein